MNTKLTPDDTAVDRYLSKYEQYEEQFNPLNQDRRARRKRKPRVNPRDSWVNHARAVGDLAEETSGLEGGFQTTYQPGELEAQWLLDSLRSFFELEQISDVTAIVKGGKEANVYRCTGASATHAGSLAAKVYRPRMFRNLSNDAMYRRGRQTLTANGAPVKANDHRTMRALGKKSSFGQQVAHTSWLMHEYTTLQKLYDAGASVPRPFAVNNNAILMSFHGDEQLAAPTLNEVSLSRDEAYSLFAEVMRNIDLLLQYGLVHGDLSAYNILYWEGRITLIDFPQVMHLHTETGQVNGNVRAVLERDIRRVCGYFQRQGVDSDPAAVFTKLWATYVHGNEELLLADLSRLEVEAHEDATWTIDGEEGTHG